MPVVGLCKGFWHVSQQEGYLNPLVSNPLVFFLGRGNRTHHDFDEDLQYLNNLLTAFRSSSYSQLSCIQSFSALSSVPDSCRYDMFLDVYSSFLKDFLPPCSSDAISFFFLWCLIYFWCCGIMGMRDQTDNLSNNISNRRMCVWEREGERASVVVSVVREMYAAGRIA